MLNRANSTHLVYLALSMAASIYRPGLLHRATIAFLVIPSFSLGLQGTRLQVRSQTTTDNRTRARANTQVRMTSSEQQPFGQAFRNLKGVFVGSGSDGLNEPYIASAILKLTNKESSAVNVLYVGTATYDLPGPQKRQTQRFVEAGCRVTSLEVRNINARPTHAEMTSIVESADVIIVSGGNTLYAVDLWTRLGLHKMMHHAMLRGAVLTGGSAGAICWFQGGHSDSWDPDSYKSAMLTAAAAVSINDEARDESSTAPTSSEKQKSWEYIRVDGLGFLPGLICPHHDKIQSNGVLRANDFNCMMLRHPTELGICIDHWAALEVDEGRFRVVSSDRKEGSVLENGIFSENRKGVPGVWLKEVRDGRVHTTLCPTTGKIEDLLLTPTEIIADPRVELCRQENPQDI